MSSMLTHSLRFRVNKLYLGYKAYDELSHMFPGKFKKTDPFKFAPQYGPLTKERTWK